MTKRAAEDVLDGLDSMLNPEDAALAEKLAMHIADVAEKDDFQEQHDNISCKISFILSLLVRDATNLQINGLNMFCLCGSVICSMIIDRINWFQRAIMFLSSHKLARCLTLFRFALIYGFPACDAFEVLWSLAVDLPSVSWG